MPSDSRYRLPGGVVGASSSSATVSAGSGERSVGLTVLFCPRLCPRCPEARRLLLCESPRPSAAPGQSPLAKGRRRRVAMSVICCESGGGVQELACLEIVVDFHPKSSRSAGPLTIPAKSPLAAGKPPRGGEMVLQAKPRIIISFGLNLLCVLCPPRSQIHQNRRQIGRKTPAWSCLPPPDWKEDPCRTFDGSAA